MSRILNIETATTVCSVSVSENENLLSFAEINEGYTHAENLHVFIKKVLADAGLQLNQLEAVAVSRGPGSYTGLRIGVSTAKGLCYALKIPLIAIDTLQIMALRAKDTATPGLQLCPMIDARRMEVYTALYDDALTPVKEVQALIVDENTIKELTDGKATAFFGDGAEKCRSDIEQYPNMQILQNVLPSARYMPQLANKMFKYQVFQDVAYFEPFYLKEFIAGKKKTEKN